jgi:hypothetical protein
MRPSTVITGEINSPYGTNTKNTNFPTHSTLDGIVVFGFCCDNGSPDGRHIQTRLLIGWSSRDMWVDSLYFLYVVFGSIDKNFPSFQHIL